MSTLRHPDASFVEFLLDQLRGLGEVVTPRRMFGGHGLYAGTEFFAIVADGRLYFKTDDSSRARHEAYNMGPFQPSEAQTLRNYMEVPLKVLEDSDQLCEWAREAICVARAPTPTGKKAKKT
jgi:DNA transformation protein